MPRTSKVPSQPISSTHDCSEHSEASAVIDSEDSSLVGESDSWEPGPPSSQAASAAPRIRGRALPTGRLSATGSDAGDADSPPPRPLSPEHPPLLIVRTESVRRGRKTSFRVLSEQAAGRYSEEREASSGKSLRQELQKAISDHRHLHVDLSHRWSRADAAAGARTAAVAGLLSCGSDRMLTIDLSNYRAAGLREGARVRSENMSERAWHKALRDSEAPALVEALCFELVRASGASGDMPELALVCRDQPMSAAVWPLVKYLALHGQMLPRLRKLDLSRYSRSEEVCEASPPNDEALRKAYAKFIGRIALLLKESISLRELGLRMNGVHSDALASIAHGLSFSRGLEQLDLSCNPLCSQASDRASSLRGLRDLARALRDGCPLRRLDLSFCGIDEQGAGMLASALTHNNTLEQINLGGNPIPPKHVIFSNRRVVCIVGVKPAE